MLLSFIFLRKDIWVFSKVWTNKILDIVKVILLLIFCLLLYLSVINNWYLALGVVVLYLLTQFLSTNKSKVGIDLCLVPVAIIIVTGINSFESSLNDWKSLIPHFTACVGWVTFWAFWAQIKANELTAINFEKQQVVDQYYEMIQVHRKNLQGLKFEKFEGTIALEKINIRYITIFKAVSEEITDLIFGSLDGKTKIDAAVEKKYSQLFHKKQLIIPEANNFKHIKLWCNFHAHIFKNSYCFLYEGFTRNMGKPKVSTYDPISDKFDIGLACDYTGLRNTLTHYYRHLFLTVKFMAKQEKKLFSYQEKRDKLRMLRAQMNNTEQLLLFYNWFSSYGKQWENSWENENGNEFFTNYKMIHNLNYKDLESTLFHDHVQLDKDGKPKDDIADEIKMQLIEMFFKNLGEILGNSNDEYQIKRENNDDPLFEFQDWPQ